MNFNAYKKVSKIIFTISLVALVSACGGGSSGGGSGGGVTPGGGGPASITNSVAQAQAAMIDSNSAADIGFYEISYAYLGKNYFINHKGEGHAFCQPGDLNVTPNLVIATGPTTPYGCDNDFTLSYEVINATTVKVTLTAPVIYVDFSGALKVNTVAVGGRFDAYILFTNSIFSQNFTLLNNGDGTFSFGAGDFASIAFTYTARSAQSNDSAVNPYFNSGALNNILITHESGIRSDITIRLANDLQNADAFPAP